MADCTEGNKYELKIKEVYSCKPCLCAVCVGRSAAQVLFINSHPLTLRRVPGSSEVPFQLEESSSAWSAPY